MIKIAALYQFAPFEDPAAIKPPLLNLCAAQGIRGTLLLAREGVNGTIAGSADGIDAVLDHIRALPGCAGLDVKYAQTDTMPFQRMKVRLKKEIVTLKVPGVDPSRDVGRYVAPEDWNALISDPDTILIDTRNDYEVAIGTFRGAIDPKTHSFGEFPDWFRANRAQWGPNPKVAMFCTGGIRCEKSTAFLRAEGIADVAHLKGGILNYLEKIPAEESLWDGECFVFDERVSVGHGVMLGQHGMCAACGWPVPSGSARCGHCDADMCTA
ncbi:MAG: rhodanese-related sulfurtransferase [Sphingomonadales bacterium]|nr:rhodanese-related sulfurtransferase [Sphingomonadales bacterium]